MTTNDIVRLKVLGDMLDNMSEEDRRNYALMLTQNNGQRVENPINAQNEKLDELIKRTSWSKSFLSDVGANVVTNAAFLILAKLFK